MGEASYISMGHQSLLNVTADFTGRTSLISYWDCGYCYFCGPLNDWRRGNGEFHMARCGIRWSGDVSNFSLFDGKVKLEQYTTLISHHRALLISRSHPMLFWSHCVHLYLNAERPNLNSFSFAVGQTVIIDMQPSSTLIVADSLELQVRLELDERWIRWKVEGTLSFHYRNY